MNLPLLTTLLVLMLAVLNIKANGVTFEKAKKLTIIPEEKSSQIEEKPIKRHVSHHVYPDVSQGFGIIGENSNFDEPTPEPHAPSCLFEHNVKSFPIHDELWIPSVDFLQEPHYIDKFPLIKHEEPKIITETVLKEVKVPVPYHVPYPVERPYPVKVSVPYPVDKPVPYPVIKKVEVPIDRPVPYPVVIEKKVAYPVKVNVEVPVPYPVEKLVPYKVVKPVYIEKRIPVPHPVYIDKPYPVPYPVHIEKKVPVPHTVYIEKRIPVPHPVYIEKRVSVPHPVYIEKRVPVPHPVYIEKRIPVPHPVYIERRISLPHPVYIEKRVGVFNPVYMEKQVPLSQTYISEKHHVHAPVCEKPHLFDSHELIRYDSGSNLGSFFGGGSDHEASFQSGGLESHNYRQSQKLSLL